MKDDSYKAILNHADSHFAEVTAAQPGNLQCGRGCSLCCHGLFGIAEADLAMVAEGLEALDGRTRRAIIDRAEKIIEQYKHPDLRDCSPREKERFFKRTEAVACPNLSDFGECLIYESRPLICRTFGLPLRDGRRFIGDICDLNFRDASDAEKSSAAWDLQWEDVVGPEDEYTIPEAVVIAARTRGWR
jgi:Fe-S-cluster containining protein